MTIPSPQHATKPRRGTVLSENTSEMNAFQMVAPGSKSATMGKQRPLLSGSASERGDNPSGVIDGAVPTPEQIIKWTKERAFDNGLIGFSVDSMPMEQVCKIMPLNAPGNGKYMTIAEGLEESSQEISRSLQIDKILTKNKPVVQEATRIVENSLLTAGMTRTEHYKLLHSRGVQLQDKIVKLYQLEHPTREAPETVHIQLLKRVDEATVMQRLCVPIGDSLNDVKDMLRRFSIQVDAKGNRVSTSEGPWKYRLINPDVQVRWEAEDKLLAQEADWRFLVKELTRGRRLALSAVIYQESSRKFQKELEVKRDEVLDYFCGDDFIIQTSKSQTARLQKELSSLHVEDDMDVLDEDGKPYFQPVDHDAWIEREFGAAVKRYKRREKTSLPSRKSVRLSSSSEAPDK